MLYFGVGSIFVSGSVVKTPPQVLKIPNEKT